MKDRFQHIKEKRLSSSASRIKKAAETPWLFAQNRQPDTEYLVIPRHSSENREYIPIGFMDPKTIAGDATTIVYDATLEDFAILESSLHVAWMKTVNGSALICKIMQRRIGVCISIQPVSITMFIII